MTHYQQGREAYKAGIEEWMFALPSFWDGVHQESFLLGYEDAAQEDLEAWSFEISDEEERADYR